MNLPDEQTILGLISDWAKAKPDVRAAILTSSRVNPEPVVDAFSDYDVELYVDDLAPYWQADDWLTAFGDVMVKCPYRPYSFKENWLTRMAVFKQGFRVDFQLSDGPLLPEHYIDGYKVLFDRDNIAARLPAPTYENYLIKPPSADAWDKLVNEFWWDAIYIAKALARDELFYASFMSDTQLRLNYFQKLLEWKVCIDHGWQTQPNKYGRFLKRYIDPALWQSVEAIFSGADIEENWVALDKGLALFRSLARELANHFGYDYPTQVDDEVSSYIEQIKQYSASP